MVLERIDKRGSSLSSYVGSAAVFNIRRIRPFFPIMVFLVGKREEDEEEEGKQ